MWILKMLSVYLTKLFTLVFIPKGIYQIKISKFRDHMVVCKKYLHKTLTIFQKVF